MLPFVSLKKKKRSKKEIGGEENGKKVIVCGSLFCEHPYASKQCALLEFGQGLGVVLTICTGYLNV